MTAFLPRHDPDPRRRALLLESARRQYRWNHSYVSPLALVEHVPVQDEWSHRWMKIVGGRVFDVLENQLWLAHDQSFLTRLRRYIGLFFKKVRYFQIDGHCLRKLVQDAIEHTVVTGRPRSLDDFGNLFRAIKLPPIHIGLFFKKVRYFQIDGHCLRKLVQDAIEHTVVTGRPRSLDDFGNLFRAIKLPPIHREFQDDRVFALMRLAGANPLVIQGVTELDDRFPVTDDHLRRTCPEDSLSRAAAEGRLYLADYRLLETVEAGTFPHQQKYVYAPLALFVVDARSRQLLPVAIQCQQKPGAHNPVFTPVDGYRWLLAKTTVEIADANLHEAVSHLGRTHLFTEPFVVAAGRQLAGAHPLYRLLRPHFEGTLAINCVAHSALINPTGVVDQLLSGTTESTRALAARGLLDYQFNQVMLPDTFRARRVDNPETLPDYAYRDDSLLYWDAIHRWVSDYLSIYYRSDDDVRGDVELQGWLADLISRDGGRVVGMGEDGQRIHSRDYLARCATIIVYTASVQHAAVNFPQYDLMSYVPNMPLAGYAAAPSATHGGAEQDYLDLLPPLDMAELAMKVLYVLGSVQYTTLGAYAATNFADERVTESLRTFQRRLNDIDETIRQRNQNRRAYEFLLPAGIPQSINI